MYIMANALSVRNLLIVPMLITLTSCSAKKAEEVISFFRPEINVFAANTTLASTDTAITFAVNLNSKPVSNVIIALAVSDETALSLSKNELVFTAQNWDEKQEISIASKSIPYGLPDAQYQVTIYPAVSEDKKYNGLDAEDLTILLKGLPAPQFTTSKSSLVVSESGTSDTFQVSLNVAPTASVYVSISSSVLSEATVNPSNLTFTADNWQTPQLVTVTGVNDLIADGDQSFSINFGPSVSTVAAFNGLQISSIPGVNQDDDSGALVLGTVQGLADEAGQSATVTIKLASRPLGDVIVDILSQNSTEVATSPNQVTFTTSNWNSEQTINLTGVDDSLVDGDQIVQVRFSVNASSADPNYRALTPMDLSVTNSDNDIAGFVATSLVGIVNESGGQGTFTIKLSSQPYFNVTLPIASSNLSEATVSPSALTFTAGNWNTPQTVTVTGVDDALVDGTVGFNLLLGVSSSLDSSYAGLTPASVTGNNFDNDSPGIAVSNLSGHTTEAGGTATFIMQLNSQPTANVTLPLSSSDTDEATVNPTSVTFTTSNWQTPQTVTVTGVDDDFDDGDKSYTVLIGSATSTDSNYSGMNPSDLSGVTDDDDVAGFIASSVSGHTTEVGGTATFTLKLSSRPTGSVSVGISSSTTAEGTVSPSSLTFTTANWNTPQTVTVTGVDENVADGNQNYSVVLAAATSSDTNYNGLDPSDVSVTNDDNDVAGFILSAVSGNTTEAGGQAQFSVQLRSQPTANVTIGLSSSDTTEGTVSPSSVTFTAANWSSAQQVTVTGVQDALVDGNQTFSIATATAVSTDTSYNGMNPNDVSLICIDDDTAGFTLTSLTGTVTEGGGQATFTIVLNSAVQANEVVTLSFTSSNAAEANASPDLIDFTDTDWNIPQTVTVTGVNDFVVDGNQNFTIVTAVDPATTDTVYDSLNPADVNGTNLDNDVAGFTISAVSGNTNEGGGTATFTVRLNSEPTANVTIGVSSSDTTEGTLSPATLSFTTANWNSNQTVTVTGVDDALQDGPQIYSIVLAAASSSDSNYNGLNPNDVSVTNIDDDSAGFIITSISGNTTETGGTASFTVKLAYAPTSNVIIGLSSNDTTEGTVAPSSLTFTTANWNAPQTVVVTGVDDAIADGNQSYTIVTAAASSSDLNYNGLNPSDVTVTNVDNDSAGFTLTAVSGNTTEAGGSATFTIKLNSEPTANVTVSLSSSDTTEGTVSPSSITFTSANWDSPQTVTVTGVDDAVPDGNQTYSVVTAPASSSDTRYNTMDPPNVTVVNTDDDSAGITVSAISGNTSESGDTATFTVVLDSPPTANVTIALSSSDTSEGTVSPSSLTFTSVNWNSPQTVTVSGVDDALQDGNQSYYIDVQGAVSSDANYNGINPPNVNLTNLDDDSPGVTVTAVSGNTSESGTTATFAVRLNSAPTANVTLSLSSSDTSEGTVYPSSLTFSTANWSALQVVTITGVDDGLLDGNQQYKIITGATSSSDSNYNGLVVPDVTLYNIDNDSPGILLSRNSGLVTSEFGNEDTFTIVLGSAPTADVTINFSSSNTDEGTVSPSQIVFTSLNWMNEQTVTVSGVDDALTDGNKYYTIVTSAAVSTDSTYNGLNPSDVTVMNLDDETPGFTIEPSTSTLFTLATSENGLSTTFTIRLNSSPSANVTLGMSIPSGSSGEGSLSLASLVFTPDNWNAPQSVIVTGLNDASPDGDKTYQVTMAPAVSSDSNYSGKVPSGPYIKNIDNDSPGVTITPFTSNASGPSGSRLTVTEDGSSEVFHVVLNSVPTADVTVTLTSSNTAHGTVSPASLTFTPANWNVAQTATVTGVNDSSTGNNNFTIQTSNTSSSDSAYNGLTVADVYFTKIDNDSARIIVSVDTSTLAPLQTGEDGTQATFTVRLGTAPTADVTIPLSSNDTSEGTISPSSLVFTPSNWNSPQTVTVTGIDDALVDGNVLYRVNFSKSSSSDSNYNNKRPSPSYVDIQNLDND